MDYINIITNPGSTVSGIAAVIMLIVAYKSGLLGFLMGGKEKGTYQGLADQMKQLQQHYNHDTTALLEQMIVNQKDMLNKLETMLQKQNEMFTYGVKSRK